MSGVAAAKRKKTRQKEIEAVGEPGAREGLLGYRQNFGFHSKWGITGRFWEEECYDFTCVLKITLKAIKSR